MSVDYTIAITGPNVGPGAAFIMEERLEYLIALLNTDVTKQGDACIVIHGDSSYEESVSELVEYVYKAFPGSTFTVETQASGDAGDEHQRTVWNEEGIIVEEWENHFLPSNEEMWPDRILLRQITAAIHSAIDWKDAGHRVHAILTKDSHHVDWFAPHVKAMTGK